MFRITPEISLDSYQKTGLRPMRRNLFPESGYACALGSYAYLNGHKDRKSANNFLLSLLSEDYVNAFMFGFDGEDLPPRLKNYEAYTDGISVWESVKHLAEF